MNGPAWFLIAMIVATLAAYVAVMVWARRVSRPARPRAALVADVAAVLLSCGAVVWVLVAARPGSQPVLTGGVTAVVAAVGGAAGARWTATRQRRSAG